MNESSAQSGGEEIPDSLLAEILDAYNSLPPHVRMGVGYKGWKGGYLAEIGRAHV